VTRRGPVWTYEWVADVILALFLCFMSIIGVSILWRVPRLEGPFIVKVLVAPLAVSGPVFAYTLWMWSRSFRRISLEIPSKMGFALGPPPEDLYEREAWSWLRRNYFTWFVMVLLVAAITVIGVIDRVLN